MSREAILDPYNVYAARLSEAMHEPHPDSDLDGVTVATKDVPLVEYAIAGQPYTYGGVPAMEGFVAEEHGEFTLRALEAGMVVTGITNAPEMGTSNHTANLLHGATINPFDAGLTAGGSSGGSAVAVRTGMIDVGFGGDGGGSLRSPAAMNGLVGHLPSIGQMEKLRDSAYDFGQPGALTRDIGLLAQVLNLMRSDDATVNFAEYLRPDARRPKVVYAVMGNLCLDAALHPENVTALKTLEVTMSGLGHEPHADNGRLPLPFADRLSLEAKRAYMRGVGIAAASSLRQIEAHTWTEVRPWRGDVSWGNWAGAQIEQVAERRLERDVEILAEAGAQFEAYMEEHGIDVIIMPTVSTKTGPFAKPEHLLRGANLALVSMLALSGVTRHLDIMKLAANGAFPHSHAPENIWHVPSTTLPVHYAQSPNGYMVPVGAKVIGRRGGDAVNLSIAQEVDGATEGGFEGQARKALDQNGAEHWLG